MLDISVDTIIIFVFIFVVFLIFYLFVSTRNVSMKNGDGGEFILMNRYETTDDGKQHSVEVLPSISQFVPIKRGPNGEKYTEDYNSFRRRVIENYNKIAKVDFHLDDEQYFISVLSSPKVLSDAFFDIYGLNLMLKNDISGFGVCEWNNKYRWNDDESMSPKRPYTYTDDFPFPINKRPPTYNIEEHITGGDGESYEFGNNLLSTFDDSDIVFYKSSRNENGHFQAFQFPRGWNKPEQNITSYVYIEYCYQKRFADITNAYRNVHDDTVEFLHELVSSEGMLPKIIIRRMFVDNDGNISKDKIKVSRSVHYIIYDFEKNNKTGLFDALNIPKTSADEGLAFDEYLEIEYEGRKFSVQVEHSESLDNHKSNILDFVVYTTKFLESNDKLNVANEILSKLGYKHSIICPNKFFVKSIESYGTFRMNNYVEFEQAALKIRTNQIIKCLEQKTEESSKLRQYLNDNQIVNEIIEIVCSGTNSLPRIKRGIREIAEAIIDKAIIHNDVTDATRANKSIIVFITLLAMQRIKNSTFYKSNPKWFNNCIYRNLTLNDINDYLEKMFSKIMNIEESD